MRTGNRELMRELNVGLVLNLVRQAGTISHAEIVRNTKLGAGTVSRIIKELKSQGFLKKVGPGDSALGRKPVMMRFNPEARYVISAVFFSDTVHVAMLDLAGNIKNRSEFATRAENGPSVVFETFAQQTESLIRESGIEKEKIIGVGIAFEGLVDADQGRLIYSASFGWRDVDVRGAAEAILGIPVCVISEGASMSLGEYCCGAGRGHDDIVCIDVDAGIGSVELLGGRVRYGHRKMAGEIGHTLIVENGIRCRCGKKGCLETVASGWAILSKTREALKNGAKSSIADEIYSESTRVAVRAVFEAARDGDELAIRVVDEAAEYLGRAIAGVINYADPEVVILMGCVADEGGEMLLNLIKQRTQSGVFEGDIKPPKIELSVLGELGVIIGAATLVYKKLFAMPIE